MPAEVDRVHDLPQPHVALLALALVLPRAAVQRAPCTKRKERTHPCRMSHSRSESAGRSQMPPPVTSPTARSCSTAQVPQPQAARPVSSPLMASSRGKATPFEESSSNLTVNGTMVRMSAVWPLLHLVHIKQGRKTTAVRARRADQATARAGATSEFTGPRCGRGSRAPCRSRRNIS